LKISNIIKKLAKIQAIRGDIDLQGTCVDATDGRFEYHQIAANIVLRGGLTVEGTEYCQGKSRAIKATKL
jgi:hypothetical protein